MHVHSPGVVFASTVVPPVFRSFPRPAFPQPQDVAVYAISITTSCCMHFFTTEIRLSSESGFDRGRQSGAVSGKRSPARIRPSHRENWRAEEQLSGIAKCFFVVVAKNQRGQSVPDRRGAAQYAVALPAIQPRCSRYGRWRLASTGGNYRYSKPDRVAGAA